LTTTRCSHPLCNTQHTTTPQPTDHHHTHTMRHTHMTHRDALDSPGQTQPEKTPHATGTNRQPTGVPSGPNSVPSPTTPTKRGPGQTEKLCVPPSQPTPTTHQQQTHRTELETTTRRTNPNHRPATPPLRQDSLERR